MFTEKKTKILDNSTILIASDIHIQFVSIALSIQKFHRFGDSRVEKPESFSFLFGYEPD